MALTEKDLTDIGFDKRLMVGTGFTSINSMTPAIYYYRKNRITINATTYWTWFLDGEQRNDIAVDSKNELLTLLDKYEKESEEILKHLFFQDWMDEEDWSEFKLELSKKGYTLERMSNDIEKGVENGYSVKEQVNLMKSLFKKNKVT